MRRRPQTIEEINQILNETMEEIKIEEVHETLEKIDRDMDTYPNPSEKEFYQKCQDALTLVGNKVKDYYYDLNAMLECYITKRSFEMSVEYEASGKEKSITVNGKLVVLNRVPGKEVLADAAKSEVLDLNYAVIVLKGWNHRAENSIKTARNHTYRAEEKEDSEDKE